MARRLVDTGATRTARMRTSDIVFFLSGAAALGYETAWARLFSRIVGSDAPGSALVLAVFMGGLGLGAWFAAPLSRRVASPVRAFVALELCVAAWAVVTPFLIARIPPIEGFAARAAVASALLLPATLLLGATFPLMGRLTIRTRAEAGSETSAFYGANTLGAAFGALLGPFVFMPQLGLSGALYASAAMDVVAAGLAHLLLVDPEPTNRDEPRVEPVSAVRDPLLVATFVLGASSLMLEVLLLRLLVTVAGASVYAFSIVTFVFLLGIGLGSRQLAERRTRTGVPGSELAARAQKSRDTVFWCALCAPLLSIAGLLALRLQLGESDLFAGLGNRVVQGESPWRHWAANALFAGLALLPPALAFGMALPSAASALVASATEDARERRLGVLYAWNTAGALVGSLVAAFVTLPAFGLRTSTAVAIALPFVAAVIVDRRRAGVTILAVVAAAGSFWFLLEPTRGGSRGNVLVHEHDAHTSVMVEEQGTLRGEIVRSLRVNGKPEASTAPVDVRLQYLLGHVPGVLHGRVRRALVVGLGTGMTAGSLLDLPELEHLRIVEISRAVTVGAATFAPWNNAVLDDPRTQLVVGDGRHHVATTHDRFDLITADPVHPWTRGSSDLYTLEHFGHMRDRLEDGGVASQWLPLYELSTEDVDTILSTWCASFEHVSAWLSAYDLILIGSSAPLPHEGDLATIALPPLVRAHDAPLSVGTGADMAALQVAGDAELRARAGGTPPMRDDRPILEFRAPLSAMSGYSTDILRWAIRPDYVERLAPAARDGARAFRAQVEQFLRDLPRGFTHAADGLGESLRSGAR